MYIGNIRGISVKRYYAFVSAIFIVLIAVGAVNFLVCLRAILTGIGFIGLVYGTYWLISKFIKA